MKKQIRNLIAIAGSVLLVVIIFFACCTVVDSGEEAYYNKTIAASLSPMIIQEDMIEKWDGKMPQIVSGNGMIMDVSKIMNK